MNTFLTFIVFAVIVFGLLYFKVPQVKAFVDSKFSNIFSKTKENLVDAFKGPSEPTSSLPGTPVPTPSKESTVGPVLASQPYDQASWTAYRNSQPASTRQFIPEVYNPTVENVEKVDITPKPFPATWDKKPLRVVTNVLFGNVYKCTFEVTGDFVGAISVTPTAADPAGQGAQYLLSLIDSNGLEQHYGGFKRMNAFTFGQGKDAPSFALKTTVGINTLTLITTADSQVWVELH